LRDGLERRRDVEGRLAHERGGNGRVNSDPNVGAKEKPGGGWDLRASTIGKREWQRADGEQARCLIYSDDGASFIWWCVILWITRSAGDANDGLAVDSSRGADNPNEPNSNSLCQFGDVKTNER